MTRLQAVHHPRRAPRSYIRLVLKGDRKRRARVPQGSDTKTGSTTENRSRRETYYTNQSTSLRSLHNSHPSHHHCLHFFTTSPAKSSTGPQRSCQNLSACLVLLPCPAKHPNPSPPPSQASTSTNAASWDPASLPSTAQYTCQRQVCA